MKRYDLVTVMSNVSERPSGRMVEYEEAAAIMAEKDKEIARMQNAVKLAYGYLWHVNTEPLAPIPMYSPERAAFEARKLLRDLLTHEERGHAINKVQGILGVTE